MRRAQVFHTLTYTAYRKVGANAIALILALLWWSGYVIHVSNDNHVASVQPTRGRGFSDTISL
jgi:hypothetical protein